MIVARAPYLDAEAPVLERMSALAVRAAKQACDMAFAFRRSSKIALLLGLPLSLPGNSSRIAETIVDRLTSERPDPRMDSAETISCGHAAALVALQAAIEKIASGRAEWCLVGGVDSYLDPEILERLDETAQLHSPSHPWGFIPGEGAGFCVLTS